MVKLQQEMTNVLVPQLEAITPGSGCYLNEVNPLHFTPPKSSLSGITQGPKYSYKETLTEMTSG